MQFRTKQTLMIAGVRQQAQIQGQVSVPWWLRLAVAAAVALAVAWVSLSAARAQEVAGGSAGGDVLAAATIKSGLFGAPESKSSNAAMVYDKHGNLHAVYSDYLPDAQKPKAAYFFCAAAADCKDGANWAGVSLLEEVDSVQLAVTPGGRPRLLMRVNSTEQIGADDYIYAECNQNCTDAGNWSGATMAREYNTLGGVFDSEAPKRNFALDSQGRPRFVYTDRNYPIEPDHYGVFYMWCDANCAQHTVANPTWHEVNISHNTEYDAEIYEKPALTFTPDDKPRIVADINPLTSEPDGVYFIGCDDACADPNSWQRAWLHVRGSETDPSWDIDVTSSGQPRVAIYEGSQLEGKGDQLYYLTCDASCFSAASWQTTHIQAGKDNGESVDIALVNDQPRLLYLRNNGNGVMISKCDGACATAANWNHTVLETSTDVGSEFPVALPVSCPDGIWDLRGTRLAYTAGGLLRIAYNASYQAYCLYDDPYDGKDETWYGFHEIQHNARYVFWNEENSGGGNGGGSGGNVKLFLPAVRR